MPRSLVYHHDFTGLALLVPRAVAMCAIIALCAGRAGASSRFGVPYTQSAFGVSSNGFAVGDLDGDGHPDVVAGGDAVTPMLEDHYGGFRVMPVVPSGARPGNYATQAHDLQLVDLNGDGKRDLLFIDGDQIVEWFGDGLGGFHDRSLVSVDPGWTTLAVGDLNRDGHPDLVASNVGARVVEVFLGQGDGTFAPPVVIPQLSAGYHIALGDLDRDGILDVVVAVRRAKFGLPGTLQSALGLGDGTFRIAGSVNTIDTNPRQLLIANVAGDSLPDLVLANSGNSFSVFTGLGNGGFGARWDAPLPSDVTGFAAADINADGYTDLLVSAGQMLAFMGSASGITNARKLLLPGSGLGSFAVADFDADGTIDLVADAGRLIARASNIRNLGNAGQISTACGLGPGALAMGDLLGDGKREVAVADRDGAELRIFKTLENGHFSAYENFPTGLQPASVAIADMDGDGAQDLLWTEAGENRLAVSYADGSADFSAPLYYATGVDPEAMIVADLDGTGRQGVTLIDRPVAPSPTPVLTFFRGFSRDGAPGRSELPVQVTPQSVAVGDYDQDGRPDIALVAGNPLVGRAIGVGDYQWIAPAPYSWSGNVVRFADMNSDGRPDLLVGDDSGLWVYLSRTDGTLGVGNRFDCPGGCTALAFADFDRDGYLDVAAINSTGIRVLMNRGDGTLWSAESYGLGDTPTAILATDLNHDGNPDLLVTLKASGTMMFIPNNAPQTILGVAPVTRAPLALAIVATPNPMRSAAHLSYTLPERGHIRLEALDVAGRRLSVIEEGERAAGPHTTRWDLRDASGVAVGPGVYLITLEANGQRTTRRVVVLR